VRQGEVDHILPRLIVCEAVISRPDAYTLTQKSNMHIIFTNPSQETRS